MLLLSVVDDGLAAAAGACSAGGEERRCAARAAEAVVRDRPLKAGLLLLLHVLLRRFEPVLRCPTIILRVGALLRSPLPFVDGAQAGLNVQLLRPLRAPLRPPRQGRRDELLVAADGADALVG